MGNTTNHCQTFGKATHTRRHPILWQTTIDEPKSSATPFHPDESRVELVSVRCSHRPTMQRFPRKVPTWGLASGLGKVHITQAEPLEGGQARSGRHGMDKLNQAATRRENQVMPPWGGAVRSGCHCLSATTKYEFRPRASQIRQP
jgi:hypothetical protein